MGEPIRVELKEGKGKAKGKGKKGGGALGDDVRVPHGTAENSVVVSGLPHATSWQDLKDHMRDAGDVMFVDIDRPGLGIVRYCSPEDVRTAIKVLDRSIFTGNKGE